MWPKKHPTFAIKACRLCEEIVSSFAILAFAYVIIVVQEFHTLAIKSLFLLRFLQGEYYGRRTLII